jgi:hypothetical protein
MTFKTGTGDEKSISEMTDEELIRERDGWNRNLQHAFFASSHRYDIGATIVTEIEREMQRRQSEGPPWLVD